MDKAMMSFVKNTKNNRSAPVKQRRIKQRLDSGEEATQKPHPLFNPRIQIQNINQALGTASSVSSMSRVRARVGVAVVRDKASREKPTAPIPSKGRKITSPRGSCSPVSIDHEDESGIEDDLWWMNTPLKTKTKSRARHQPSPSNLSLSPSNLPPSPPPQNAAIDDSSKSTEHGVDGAHVFAAFDGGYTFSDLDEDGDAYGDDVVYTGSAGAGEALSISSWLSPPQSVAARETKRTRSAEEAARPHRAKRARPTKGVNSDNIGSSRSSAVTVDGLSNSATSRMWAKMGYSRHAGIGVASGAAPVAKTTSSAGSSLSAWLEPRNEGKDAKKKNKRKAKGKIGFDGKDGGDANADHEYEDAESSCGNVVGEDWISERLGGLDPGGVARAKNSWADRERRHLTATDVALGAKRKSSGKGNGRGWRTRADGAKVFVAATRGGTAAVAKGQAAFRMSLGR